MRYFISTLLDGFILKTNRVGSRVTCNPAPTDTDDDRLVLVSINKMKELHTALRVNGFELGGSIILDKHLCDNKSNIFWSFTHKDSDLNFIITNDDKFYDKFLYATEISKLLNLIDKKDRINLFQFVLYGEIN